ncbi:MAG: aquaporin, partial [Proteobacteria bacterium]|nr:aquaporin [Pseudomonadota bacterium]
SSAVSPSVSAITPMQAILAEFLGTFALCYVILNVATASKTSGNSFYGLAIGFTVLSGAYVFGGISGGVFNPAVFLGITLSGMQTFANIWIYLIGQLSAAIVAAFVFRYIDSEAEA